MSAHTGLRDAHLHLAEHGEQLDAVNVSGCSSLEECLALVREACRADRRTREDWLVCEGMRSASWGGDREPTADDLQRVSSGTPLEGAPIVVRSFDHHGATATSAALGRATITSGSADTDADGRVWESAYLRLMQAIPERDDDEERRCVLDAHRDLVSHGFVEAHDMHATARLARTLLNLDDKGQLTLRVVLYATPDHVDAVRSLCAASATECIAFGGLKLFIDGTLSGRTAFMLEPYVDGLADDPCGQWLIDDDTVLAHMRSCDALGEGLACHAIGDAAVRRLLDLDDCLAAELGRLPRHVLRLEHAQFVHPSDIQRIAERIGDGRALVVSPQPSHLLTDIEATRRHAPHAEERAFPLRSIVDSMRAHGVDPARHVVLGSDTPIVSPSPTDTLRAAVDRRREGMNAAEALNPSEAVDDETALSLYRAGATVMTGTDRTA